MQIGYNETVLSERGRKMSMGGSGSPNQCMQLAIMPPLSLTVCANPWGSSAFILVRCGHSRRCTVHVVAAKWGSGRQHASF